MKVKRALNIPIFASFIAVLSTIVSAETVAQSWWKSASIGLTTFFDQLYIEPYTLSILLLGVLLWIILYTIVSEIFSFKGHFGSVVAAAVSLIIVVLSFLYLPKNFVQTIVLQYGAMGATILTIIPFAIIMYFTVSVTTNLFFGRMIWIFYMIYYFTLFIYKIGTVEMESSIAWYIQILPYLGALIAGIVVFILLPTIRSWWWKGELKAAKEKGMRDVQLRELGRKIEREEAETRFEG